MDARDLIVSLLHVWNAVWEDVTADRTSSLVDRATFAIGDEDDDVDVGDRTGMYWDRDGGVALPWMKLFILRTDAVVMVV